MSVPREKTTTSLTFAALAAAAGFAVLLRPRIPR
jgi:hypothetical protein